MNQFNNLPPEIIEFIFKKVHLDDLINLRIVDKRFKQICEQIKIKQLSVTDIFYYYYYFWFYTNDPTYSNKENQVKISKFLNYKSIFRLDKYLKRLSIYGKFNISILNEFKLLEHLEIAVNYLNDNYELNLENLKIANIVFENDFDCKLTLDTNKLFAFTSSSHKLDQFIFKYPHKILFYETDYYDDQIKIFTNLQYLKLNGMINSIDRDILSKFKHLKTLDLNIRKFIHQNEYDNLKNGIISILDEKDNLRRSELQIYLFGVELINQIELNQLKWSSDEKQFKYNLLEFQIRNYDLLKDNCSYMYKINYCDLIKLIKVIPSSFTNKYSYIHQVYADDHIDNEDQFIKFLNSLPSLFELKLNYCGLTKSFYDKLINLIYLNNLICLIIKEKEELGLNFDFILNLKQLEKFDTNQSIENHVDLISNLFKENQNIHEFIFKFGTNNYIRISKINYYYFKIDLYYLNDNLEEIKNFPIKDLNLKCLISKLKNLKLSLFYIRCINISILILILLILLIITNHNLYFIIMNFIILFHNMK